MTFFSTEICIVWKI
ncbi:unnamed protein product [Acanthoscelides obtectus]|uniref:Uncharacterized protein n=1 Tax=Acanthoscelides obtectus TaxID=200917 RepID=A0A9P0QB08_ACAOB|nr:unnamed protein product [Acanthoscelides obtectus]